MKKDIRQYGATTFDIIKGASILEDEDFKSIENLQEELLDVFKYSQVFRTRTEMDISVLNDLKHPTPDSKYWQAMKEQNVMFTELVKLSYEYRKTLIEIKKLERDKKSCEDALECELMDIEIEKYLFACKQQERVAKDRIREIVEWQKIKEELRPFLVYSDTDVNEHQLDSYTKRFINQQNVMGVNGSPSEKSNLLGQLNTAMKKVKERGDVGGILEKLTMK